MENTRAITLYKNNDPRIITEARSVCEQHNGKEVLLRGLIEFSNYCAFNCSYCGIRHGNSRINRYRLGPEEILNAVRAGFERGLRTFVLQSGEDPYFTDNIMENLIYNIRKIIGDKAAITLSLGVRSRKSYMRLKKAGADRYLLRFETADPKLHVMLRDGMPLDRRLEAITDLQDTGFETGSGFMIGLPGEKPSAGRDNALLAQRLNLDMVGIGPFIAHPETPLAGTSSPSIEDAVRLTALVRLLLPLAHIPATTAAGTLSPTGREKMIQAGANVLMPNITPVKAKKDYLLYPGKICLDESGLECIGCLSTRMMGAGRCLSFSIGSAKRLQKKKGRDRGYTDTKCS